MAATRRQFCRSTLYALTTCTLGSGYSHLACSDDKEKIAPQMLERLAFGSCNKHDQLQNHWQTIGVKDPQAWLWMGDAVYADGSSPQERSLIYRQLLHNSYYQRFSSKSLIFGTWDDHDYAANDVGADYPLKEASKKAYLDFIGEPEDTLRRQRAGIYDSNVIGSPDQSVQLILLDMRYFKPKAGRTADPLGKVQWQWLEAEIKRPGPQLKLLVTSIQLLTDFTGRETWAIFPEAQQRMLQLLASSPVPLVILSGDRHLSEVSQHQLDNGRNIFELTASGLTHKAELTNSNPYRIGEQIAETNFGLLKLNWETQGKTRLKEIVFSAHSPQSGEQLRSLEIPLS